MTSRMVVVKKNGQMELFLKVNMKMVKKLAMESFILKMEVGTIIKFLFIYFCYKGYIKNDQFSGEGIFQWSDGRKYEGEWH